MRSEGNPLKRIPLARALNEVEAQTFVDFYRLASELVDNYFELAREIGSYQASFSNDDRVTSTQPLPFSRHRLKGLLVDYRQFHHHKPEESRFVKASQLALEIASEQALKNEIERNATDWQSAGSGLEGWRNPFTTFDLIEALFNTTVFHADKKPRYSDRTKKDLDQYFDDSSIWHAIFEIVRRRTICVKNLRLIISPLANNRNELLCP